MNLKINELKENLINLLNSSGVPIGAAYFVLKDCFNDLEKTYQSVLEYERQNQDQETQQVEIPLEGIKEEENNDN